MKKYNLGEYWNGELTERDLHLKNATEQEIREWLARDLNEKMWVEFKVGDKDYLSEMKETSENIIKVCDLPLKELNKWLEDRGFGLVEIEVNHYEIRVSEDGTMWQVIGKYEDIEVAKELKNYLLEDKFGFNYVEIWNKEKNECVSYTLDN